ncbi:O-methyltransferase [Reichenbachiella agariperforans]|uniref:O-methyltransferase n=1 Tax=Reichenbachiella agariperforans TaxID=156994 RepID=A0A1M6PYL7_REIAG|nr:class I SAM-dependent methyltransferase [Reichenbachiella agariperforans]SHK13039.1 O-methyltransferase [Reichenbachiella agariperforans]
MNISAIDAKYEAQKIAFAPITFQAIMAMKNLGVMEYIYKKRGNATQAEIIEDLGISKYSVEVMLETAEVMDIIETKEGKLSLSKIGFFLLRDELTRVNMNFVNDVCYDGSKYLEESLATNKPAGLKVFGEWDTVYEGLSKLEKPVRKSWLEFDHFYSQDAFDSALEIVFKNKPGKLFDIGGNTGKWSIKCCGYDSDVNIKILDLPGQIEMAKKNIADNNLQDRIEFHPINLLDTTQKIPQGADVIWMSQFLDCFSEEEILVILLNCAQASTKDTTIYIMEPFIDNQPYEAATYSLVATSLYFTCIANGNSKMYKLETFKELIDKAGMQIIETHALIGDSYHTILACKLK